MEAFASDFSSYWLREYASESSAAPKLGAEDEPLPPSLKEALDALTERINAARSIV